MGMFAAGASSFAECAGKASEKRGEINDPVAYFVMKQAFSIAGNTIFRYEL